MSNHIRNYLNTLFEDIIKYIEEVKQELNKLSDNIKRSLEVCDSFKTAIINYINYLELLDKIEDKTQFKNKELIEELLKICKLNIEQNIKMKDNIDNIEKLNTKIDLKYNEFINYDFNPDSSVNINDYNQNDLINNSINNNKDKTPPFIDNFLKENYNYEDLSNNNEIYKCSFCLKQKAIVYSKKKKILFCESCFSNYIENNNNDIYFDKDITNLENIDIKNNENIKSFINSIDILIKNILMRCDYIMNNEELVSIIDTDNKIKILEYPNIINENKDCFDFFKQVYNISKDINHKTFNLSNLNKEIITIVRHINGSINNESIINQNINNQSINNQNIIDQVLDNIYDKYDSDGSFDEKYVQNEGLKMNKGKYFCFSVNSILKSNSEIEIRNKFSQLLMQNFSINNEDIFISFNYNNKIIFIDNFIKTQKFIYLSCEDIKKLYPNLEELYEYKNIFDSLIKEYNIKDYIDYRGNFIIQNMKETKEKYYPPYEWIGIGLKVLGKYENDNWLTDNSKNNEWAIAYHGVGGKLSIREVKYKLEKKIKEGLRQGNSQRQCNLYDSRHPGKRIGTGVYLTSNINKVEDFSGIIQLNKKKYRVALMSKVKIDKIRQAINSNTWILNPKYIRIYRILLKKV